MAEMSGVVSKLFKKYEIEGIHMPYTMEDFRREYLEELTPEERLKGLSRKQIVAYLKKFDQGAARQRERAAKRKRRTDPRRKGS